MEKSQLEEAVKNSTSFSEVSRLLYGNNFYGNRVTIKKYIKEFGIDIHILHSYRFLISLIKPEKIIL